jgi:YHS domain-containing protein
MKKVFLPFVIAFAIGSVAALALRSASHEPYAAAPAPTADPHAGHVLPAEVTAGTVNTVCPICGMDVDPSLEPAEYKGKKVGFGCRACPPKFTADPEKYGPAALKNEVVN